MTATPLTQTTGMSADDALDQTKRDLNASRREMVLVGEIERLRAENASLRRERGLRPRPARRQLSGWRFYQHIGLE